MRPGDYPRGGHLKGAPLGQAPVLLPNIALGWKGLPGKNTLSLFGPFVIYTENSFVNPAPEYPEKTQLVLALAAWAMHQQRGLLFRIAAMLPRQPDS